MRTILTHKSGIGDLLKSITLYFQKADLYYGHGTDNPADEAYGLIAGYLADASGRLQSPEALLKTDLTPEQAAAITALAKARVETRKPLAYLLRKAWFADLLFQVDERVIIPRSPLAELIMNQFSPWLNPGFDQTTDQPFRVLDLCTGSGCIALAMAHYFPRAQVDAVDISLDALALAQENLKWHQLEARVQFVHSDLFEALNPRHRTYDLIISNPPYVDAQDMATLPPEYQHEPRIALEAGEDGLNIVNAIMQQASAFLKPEGLLFMEVGNSCGAFEAKYADWPITWLEFERGGEGVLMLSAKDWVSV